MYVCRRRAPGSARPMQRGRGRDLFCAATTGLAAGLALWVLDTERGVAKGVCLLRPMAEG